MSSQLRQYLLDTYETRRTNTHPRRIGSDFPIQIDDQDNNDKLGEFCNIFCIVLRRDEFRLDLIGNFPVTQQITDLADIYNGYIIPEQSRLTIVLSIRQIDAVMDLADRIKKTAFMGDIIGNPNWLSISSRTISSLYRFVRIIKEFKQNQTPDGILLD